MRKVAFTAFRNNLAYYLEIISSGTDIVIINTKRNKVMAVLKGKKK
jgi:hypothetical protein